ncbi:hypothetical protein [Aquabacterium sp. CECT 9606]|uniref:hypothetical protein n=1 Tax=Aquabacterium sp. CECT 9606 TaxID=2845822 RepID=UPI001E5970A4|nr:hypothetical protein [Aquabacterium sp. CECT 9606]CAH0354798.1 hypothetical protein AQB9606_03947 [Aquabacterium sp. CECT 9606]
MRPTFRKLSGYAIVTTLSALLLPACSTNISRTTTRPEPNESIIVFGVKPDNARLSLFPGEIVDGKFKQNVLLDTFAKIHDVPSNGYVTAKVKTGQALALTSVQMSINGTLWGPQFSFCNNPKLLSFEVPSGKIAYAADIEFVQVGNVLRPRVTQDIESARKHIKESYPNLTDELVPLDLQLIPASRCEGPAPQTINVYVPGR